MTTMLLLSGGLDSSSIAAWKRPDVCMMIDYGQVAARRERQAAAAVSHDLQLRFETMSIDCSQLGRGTLAAQPRSAHSEWDEFWPFRNQLLVTMAAAWAVEHGVDEIMVGSIRTDDRHADGSGAFYGALSSLLQLQEGAITVHAPAIGLTCHELIKVSGIADSTLSWSYSCHSGSDPCNVCSGCQKRVGALARAGRLQWRETTAGEL